MHPAAWSTAEVQAGALFVKCRHKSTNLLCRGAWSLCYTCMWLALRGMAGHPWKYPAHQCQIPQPLIRQHQCITAPHMQAKTAWQHVHACSSCAYEIMPAHVAVDPSAAPSAASQPSHVFSAPSIQSKISTSTRTHSWEGNQDTLSFPCEVYNLGTFPRLRAVGSHPPMWLQRDAFHQCLEQWAATSPLLLD
jgi:hypothetical protein